MSSLYLMLIKSSWLNSGSEVGSLTSMKMKQDHIVMSRRYGGQEGDICHGCCHTRQLFSDHFHLNNKNNQLENQVLAMFSRCPVIDLSTLLE